MPNVGFIGLRVVITISDPWDLTSENSQPIPGAIVEFNLEPGPVFLVNLDQPVRQGELALKNILANVRHQGVDPSVLKLGQEISCNCSGVPVDYRLSDYVEHRYPGNALPFLAGMKLISQ